MSWLTDESFAADDGPATSRRQIHQAHPLPMVYAPPNRLTVPLPTATPFLGTKDGPTKPLSLQKRRMQPITVQRIGNHTVQHETAAVITLDTPVAWWAVNLPRRSDNGSARHARQKHGDGGALCPQHVSSRDIFSGTLKGWVEPNFDEGPREASDLMDACDALGKHVTQAPRATGLSARQLQALPVIVLQRCFSYLDTSSLDEAVVHVCRRWYHAVSACATLRKVRMAFELAGAFDGRGVLYYLATRRRGAPDPSQLRSAPESLNPCVVTNPSVQAHTIAYPQASSARGRDQQQPLSPPALFTSFGPSLFATPNVPFAWIGVEFLQGFAVEVRAYTFSLSSGSSASPLSWELQGCCRLRPPAINGSDDWSTAEWHVLHKHDASKSVSPFQAGQRTATIRVDRLRWGPMIRLRIVQTSRNSQWGHTLAISGFDVYGALTKCTKGS